MTARPAPGGDTAGGYLADSELPGPARGWQVRASLPGGAQMLFGVYASTGRTAATRAVRVISGTGGQLAGAYLDITPVPPASSRAAPGPERT